MRYIKRGAHPGHRGGTLSRPWPLIKGLPEWWLRAEQELEVLGGQGGPEEMQNVEPQDDQEAVIVEPEAGAVAVSRGDPQSQGEEPPRDPPFAAPGGSTEEIAEHYDLEEAVLRDIFSDEDD